MDPGRTNSPDEPREPGASTTAAEAPPRVRYARAQLRAALLELVIPVLFLAGLTLSGAAGVLLRLSQPSGAPEWLGHLFFLLAIGVLTRLVQLPLQWVREYWLDRRFGLARQSGREWFGEWLVRSAAFGTVTVAALLPVVETLRWPWLVLLWSGAFLLLRPLFYDYVYYPLLERFYPARFLRHETFVLPGIGKVTLPVYQVRVSHKTRRVNASIRLRGPKTAIYVTDTLIDEFTDGEERIVMAHEFGHLYDRLHLESRTRAGIAQAHRKLVLGVGQLLAAVLALLLVHWLSPALRVDGVWDLRGFPLLAGMTFGFSHLLAPLLCREARRDEHDADEYALAVTGDVENYVSVMRKLREINLEEDAPSLLGRLLFDTHPSSAERIDLARQFRRRFPARRKNRHWRGWRHIQRHGRR